jgi:hypothetical protein
MFTAYTAKTVAIKRVPKKLFSTMMKPFVMIVVQRGTAND